MKKCRDCGEIKDLKDFYSIRTSYCKECEKKRSVLWKRNNPQRVKEHHIKRRAKPGYREEHAEYARNWRKNDLQRIKTYRANAALWKKNNPEKTKARELIASALKSGKIKKPTNCSKCGEKRKILGHHPDYRFPLEITWLCYSCHAKLNFKESS